jgi:hypothetical protein
MIDAHRGPHGEPPTLWSTYAGLLEARNGIFHPNFDYVIHALGPENRVAYVSEFARLKPTLVQTVDPLYTQYEAWIEGTSWDFYDELLRNYDIAGSTEWSLFWRRRAVAGPAPRLVWRSDVKPGMDGIQLPTITSTDSIALLQVELDYTVHNPLHILPVVGTMPRYLVAAGNAVQKNPVTLNPYVKTTRFPLLVVSGKPAGLQWHTFGLLPASIEVTGIRLYSVDVSPANRIWLNALISEETHALGQ